MSTSRAIEGVTALLQSRIAQALLREEGLIAGQQPKEAVTIGPPQIVRGSNQKLQVNIFLYQVFPDAAWRNLDPPVGKSGERRAPLLAVKLHYLLTIFAGISSETSNNEELTAHRALGAIMLNLHDLPELRGLPEDAAASGLSDALRQYERPRATLQPLSNDDLSKLWAGFQTPYRVSVAYEVSPVLIDSMRPAESSPPVLSRGDENDRGFAAAGSVDRPQIEALRFAAGQRALDFNRELVLIGSGLEGVNLRLLINGPRLKHSRIARPTGDVQRERGELRSAFPKDWTIVENDPVLGEIEVEPVAENWPPGVYSLSAAQAVASAGVTRLYSTAAVTLPLMPKAFPDNDALILEVNGGTEPTAATLEFLVIPPLALDDDGRLLQQVRIFIGSLECAGQFDASDEVRDGTEIPGETDDTVRLTRVVATLQHAKETVDELRRRDSDSLFLRVQVDGVDDSMLDRELIPRRRFDENLLVTIADV